MKPDEFKSLIKAMGNLIDLSTKTTETVIKAHVSGEIKASEKRTKEELRAEIRASEERTKEELRAEIRASEERTKEELRAEILASRAEAHADNLMLNANFVKKAQNHERRIENLEEKTHTDNPTKN